MLGQSCSPCPPNSAVSAPLQSQAVPDMAAISLTPGRAAPPSNSRHRLGPQRSAAEPMQAPGWAALIPKDAPFPRMTVPAASSVPALTGAPRPWPMGSHCHPVGPHGSLLRASLVKPAPTPGTAGAASKSSHPAGTVPMTRLASARSTERQSRTHWMSQLRDWPHQGPTEATEAQRRDWPH